MANRASAGPPAKRSSGLGHKLALLPSMAIVGLVVPLGLMSLFAPANPPALAFGCAAIFALGVLATLSTAALLRRVAPASSEEGREITPRVSVEVAAAKPAKAARVRAPDATPPAVVLDEAGLLALVGSDAFLLRERVDAFLQDSPRRLAEIAKAIDSADRRMLAREARSLKDSVTSLGGLRAPDALRRLEAVAKAGSLQDAGTAYAAVAEEVRKLQRALSEVVRTHGS